MQFLTFHYYLIRIYFIWYSLVDTNLNFNHLYFYCLCVNIFLFWIRMWLSPFVCTRFATAHVSWIKSIFYWNWIINERFKDFCFLFIRDILFKFMWKKQIVKPVAKLFFFFWKFWNSCFLNIHIGQNKHSPTSLQ